MQVFVTGGTGTIGSAVVPELLAHGHTVLALARSDASARRLTETGAEVVRGQLSDLDVLRQAAEASDGVVNLAFNHDFSAEDALPRAIAEESAALEAIGSVLVGTGKPFVTSSGTPWIPGRTSTEADPLPTEGPLAGRALAVTAMLALADRGVRSAAVRLPRTVHIDGTGGFAGMLADTARRTGVAGYPGDGTQRWPAVHARDAAALFRIVLETAPAGTSWHAVADSGDTVRDMVEVIGRRLGLPVQQVPAETFGPFGPFFVLDQPSTGDHTRATLGWEPTHPSLLEDLETIAP